MQPQEQNKSSIGSIIGTIIIITVIILGGLYFWGKRVQELKYKDQLINQNNTSTETTQADEATKIKMTTSGDDLKSIETDLNNTNTTNMSAELDLPL
ncbi:MAG: hypothetical protein WAW92_00200 [Minisyncoccia bacterium]